MGGWVGSLLLVLGVPVVRGCLLCHTLVKACTSCLRLHPETHPASRPCWTLPACLQITVVAGEVIRRYASGAMTEEQEPQDRHPQGEAAGGVVLVIIA